MGSRTGTLLGGVVCAAALALGAGAAHAAARPVAASASGPASSSSTEHAGGGSSVPLSVPLGAFAIAVAGSLGAYAHSRRADRRAAAMARHPAHRGVGRDPRRARR